MRLFRPRRHLRLRRAFVASLLVAAAWVSSGRPGGAEDWPQWRGPSRDGHSAERGLIEDWREQPPREVWRVPVGAGYSGISVVGGRLFTLYADAESEYLAAFSSVSGERLWRVRLDRRFDNEWGDGPRATPTVVGNRVYATGARGQLVAVDTETGYVVWRRDLFATLGGRPPALGYSSSALVDSDRLYLPVGNSTGNAFVALSLDDGSVIWKAHDDATGYSSPILVSIGGERQLIFFAGRSIAGLSTEAELLWRIPAQNSANENVATPIFVPPDRLFFSAAHDVGALMVRVTERGRGTETVWAGPAMKNHFSSSVLVDGHLYGTDGAIFKCLDADTGAECWKTRGFGEGSVITADGDLYVLGTRGNLALVEATPTSFREKGSIAALSGRSYTAPSLADGRLYLRNGSEMAVYDVREHARGN